MAAKRTAVALPSTPRAALRRERERAASWLRAHGRSTSRRAVDRFLWSHWYRLDDDVCRVLARSLERFD